MRSVRGLVVLLVVVASVGYAGPPAVAADLPAACAGLPTQTGDVTGDVDVPIDGGLLLQGAHVAGSVLLHDASTLCLADSTVEGATTAVQGAENVVLLVQGSRVGGRSVLGSVVQPGSVAQVDVSDSAYPFGLSVRAAPVAEDVDDPSPALRFDASTFGEVYDQAGALSVLAGPDVGWWSTTIRSTATPASAAAWSTSPTAS